MLQSANSHKKVRVRNLDDQYKLLLRLNSPGSAEKKNPPSKRKRNPKPKILPSPRVLRNRTCRLDPTRRPVINLSKLSPRTIKKSCGYYSPVKSLRWAKLVLNTSAKSPSSISCPSDEIYQSPVTVPVQDEVSVSERISQKARKNLFPRAVR